MPADRIGSAYSEHPLSRRLLRSCAASPRPMLAAPSGRCRHPLDPNTNSWQTHEDTLSSSAAQNLPLRVVSARGGIACRRTPLRLRISRNADSRRPQKRSGQRKNGAYRQAGKRGLYTSRKIVHTDNPSPVSRSKTIRRPDTMSMDSTSAQRLQMVANLQTHVLEN